MLMLTAITLVLGMSLGNAEDTSSTIEGMCAVVTSGGGDIGSALIDALLGEGASLVFAVDSDKEACQNTATTYNTKYGDGKCECIVADVNNDLEEVANYVDSKCVVTILVNTADKSSDSTSEVIQTNLIAVEEWTNRMYKDSRTDQGGQGGAVINLSTIPDADSMPVDYAAAAAGVRCFSEAMGHLYRYTNTKVKIVSLMAGFTSADMTSEQIEASLKPVDLASVTIELIKGAETGKSYIYKDGNYELSRTYTEYTENVLASS